MKCCTFKAIVHHLLNNDICRHSQEITNPAAMGAKTTTAPPPTPNVMPMVPPMMSSPVVGTMPPPPAVPANVQSNISSAASNVTPNAGVSSSPTSEVISNASSGGMGSPSPQQMMPASIPDVPLFGTGPPTAVPAPVQSLNASEAFQVNFNKKVHGKIKKLLQKIHLRLAS